MTNDISEQVRNYIVTELLPEDADPIEDGTPLISSGTIDSIATLQLVTFLEDTFDVSFQAREVGIDFMDTVESITDLVNKKRSA